VISLRWQLFVSLLALYLATAAVAMGVSYRQYAVSVNAFMDGQIHAVALGYAQQLASFGARAFSRPLERQDIQHHGSPIEQIWTTDGRLFDSSYPTPALSLQVANGFHSIHTPEGNWRTYTMRAGRFELQVVQSNDFRRRVIMDSAWKSAAPIAVLIPFSALLLWFAVYLALRPVGQVINAIAEQNARTLKELPTANIPRELFPLITSMNNLIVRLRDAFASQRRFVQDAAHELRTPLAACMLQAEGVRRNLGAAFSDDLDRLQLGLRRMQRLIEQLLRLAHEDAEHSDYPIELIDVPELLKSSVGNLIALAEQRGVDLGIAGIEPCRASTNPADLRSILDNLLENAVRYTPSGGCVDVWLGTAKDESIIEIIDTGPGIPSESLDLVFDRFYRVPGSGVEGSGIGLAIVRSAAERSGINVELKNRGEPSGLIARVSTPRIT